MASVHHSSLKIDRLSSLPPELLLSIFDLAYDPEQLLLEPLSKRLLPYFQRNFYRQIRISSRSSWFNLLRTVKDCPSLGKLVLDFDTSEVFHDSQPGTFEEIIKPFPRLNSVKTGYLDPIQHTSVDFRLPPLEHLSYECESPEIETLVFLSRLHLATLEIIFHTTWPGLTPAQLPQFQTVEGLSLVLNSRSPHFSEEAIWIPSLVNIVHCCPNITSLRLFDPQYPNYESFLSSVFPTGSIVTSLALESARLDDAFDIACDHLLPRFSQVTYLSLGDGTTSQSLPLYLRQMPSLSTLRLGIDAHLPLRIDALLPLFQGPTRHLSLCRLILDCFEAPVGLRIQTHDKVGPSIGFAMERDGWIRPELYHLTFDALTDLFLACRINGIEVEGNGASILEDLMAYDREDANRAILQVFQSKSFESFQYRPAILYFTTSTSTSSIRTISNSSRSTYPKRIGSLLLWSEGRLGGDGVTAKEERGLDDQGGSERGGGIGDRSLEGERIGTTC